MNNLLERRLVPSEVTFLSFSLSLFLVMTTIQLMYYRIYIYILWNRNNSRENSFLVMFSSSIQKFFFCLVLVCVCSWHNVSFNDKLSDDLWLCIEIFSGEFGEHLLNMVINLRVKTLDSQDHEFSVEDDVSFFYLCISRIFDDTWTNSKKKTKKKLTKHSFDMMKLNSFDIFHFTSSRLPLDSSKSVFMKRPMWK